MPDGLSIQADLNSARAFMRDLDKKAAAVIRKEVRAAVSAAGTELISDMQKRASWSSRIPAATTLKTSFSDSKSNVSIRTDKKKAPHARPLEFGNKTNFDESIVRANGGWKTVNGRRVVANANLYKEMKRTGTGVSRGLKHPVFHKVGEPGGWASMPTRPFFFAATEAGTASVNRRIGQAIDEIAKAYGFKGV